MERIREKAPKEKDEKGRGYVSIVAHWIIWHTSVAFPQRNTSHILQGRRKEKAKEKSQEENPAEKEKAEKKAKEQIQFFFNNTNRTTKN